VRVDSLGQPIRQASGTAIPAAERIVLPIAGKSLRNLFVENIGHILQGRFVRLYVDVFVISCFGRLPHGFPYGSEKERR